MAKITIKDVATESGVSISTVSRVLNNNPKVDPALTRKVMDAAQRLGYRPSIAAHSIRSERTNQIAFVVPALENTYFSTIASGIIDTAREYDQNVIVMTTHSDIKQEEECLHSLSTAYIDGIIFASSNGQDPTVRFPSLTSIPTVIAARRHIADGIPHVYADNENAGYIATKYLLRLNRKKIALFANFWGRHISSLEEFWNQYNSDARGGFTALDRYTGYRRALDEEYVPFDPNLIIFSGYSFDDGYQDAQNLLASAVDFDAILAPNDRVGAGILRLLNEQGIRVPGQISVICFNGGLMANVVSPPLTLIQQDNYQLGVQAVHQLNAVIRGEQPQNVCLGIAMKIQSSTSLLEAGTSGERLK